MIITLRLSPRLRAVFVLPLIGGLTALALLATGPARAAPPEPRRIVSVGGAVTETLYALGLDAEIVGVDTTSLFPESALKTKPNVGYARSLSAEGILSLKPSAVLAIDYSGPPGALGQVQGAGVAVALIAEDPSAAGVSAKVEAIGALVGKEEQAGRLAADIRARFAALERDRATIKTPVKAIFILAFRDGRAMVAGRGTAADGMLRLAGAVNAAAGIEGYKAMTDEAVIAAAPDAVVLMQTGNATIEDVAASPAFSVTPAGRNRAIHAFDGNYLLGFGPRAPDAAQALMRSFYPALRDGK